MLSLYLIAVHVTCRVCTPFNLVVSVRQPPDELFLPLRLSFIKT